MTLDALWLDRTEVTNAQFAAFVADTGYVTTAEAEGGGFTYTPTGENYTSGASWQHPQGPGSDLSALDEHPVVLASWEDAVAFATWAGGRLPTEVKWEYAARGQEGFTYPWGNEPPSCERLNFNADCVGDTSQVGSYPAGASWVGTLDMAGNVWEWVNDWYDESYYQRSPAANPPGPNSGDFRVLRGGSWISNDRGVRAADREGDNPNYRSNALGFRVAEPFSDPDS